MQTSFWQTTYRETELDEEFSLDKCYVKVVRWETAARMAVEYHYAHRKPSITAAFGLYIHCSSEDRLAGIITYGPPAAPNTRRVCGDMFERMVLELNRLFVFDYAKRNTESWFISQTFKLLRQVYPDYPILISYADTKQGHIGYIYQATNWIYTGLSEAMDTSGWYIDGHEYHNISVNDMIGSNKKADILARFPDAIPIKGSRKHRYVYFLKERKYFLTQLRWEPKPYPKGGNNGEPAA